MSVISRISAFLYHVFIVPEEIPLFQELFVDKNPYYTEETGGYWYLDGSFVALEYNEDFKRELEAYKYYSKRHKKDILLPKLIECFDLFCLENTSKDVIITTVPLHILSYLKRGYNHSELLARGLAAHEGNLFLNLLKKTRLTKHQARLSRGERLKNVRNSFSLRDKYSKTIAGRDIIIIDDVVSTGSTANECAKLLKERGAKRVFGLFLATQTSL